MYARSSMGGRAAQSHVADLLLYRSGALSRRRESKDIHYKGYVCGHMVTTWVPFLVDFAFIARGTFLVIFRPLSSLSGYVLPPLRYCFHLLEPLIS